MLAHRVMPSSPAESPRSSDDPIDGLLEEYMARRLRGEDADFEALLAAHPEHADELREEVRAWEGVVGMLDRLAREKSSSDVASAISGERPASTAAEVPLLRETLARLARRHGSFGRYALKTEVGRGGMGAVMRVWDEDLRRHLAMKVVLPEGSLTAAPRPAASDPRRLGRFFEEAQITAQLDHPGIVPVHELGLTNDGRVYFTMKLVQGRDLQTIFDLSRAGQEGWSPTRAVGVLLKVCEAMGYAHHKGVVHRDLKPANIMVGGWGEVYVMDWGLARVLGRQDSHDLRPDVERRAPGSEIRSARDEVRESDTDSPLLTADGTVLGTPAYMPPEQAAGKIEEVNARSDVYAVGAMLYHLLAGHPPYLHGKPLPRRALLLAVLQGPPPSLHRIDPTVQPELAAICEKAMAREIGARYATMGDLAEDLRAFLERRVVRAYETGALAEFRKWVARNRTLAATILAALVLLLGGSSAASLVLAGKNEALGAVNDELAQQSYEAAISAADGALRAGDVRGARRYLARPASAERGWEWLYLASLTDTSERTLYGHSQPVRSLALDALGNTIASYGNDQTVRTWDYASGQELSRFTIPDPGWPHQLHFSPGATLVASTLFASETGVHTLTVWDVRTGKAVHHFPLPETLFVSAAFSADDRRLAAGAESVRVLDLEHDELVWERGFGDRVLALAFSPDGSSLAVRTRREDLWIVDASSGTERLPRIADARLQGRALAWDRTGARLAAPTMDDTVRIWDARTGQPLLTLAGNNYDVWSIDFHPDGNSLLTGSGDGVLRSWSLAGGGKPLELLGHRYGARALFHPNGREIVSASHDRTLRVWSVSDRGEILPSQEFTGEFSIFESPDERFVAVRNKQSMLSVWDLPQRRELWSLQLDPRVSASLAFRPDGESLVVPGADGTISMHASTTGELQGELRGHSGIVHDLALHPRDAVLASAAADGTVRLWSLDSRAEIAALPCGPEPVRTVAFDAAGERLVAAGDDARIRIFARNGGRLLRELGGAGPPLWDARFVDGDRHLVTLSRNGESDYEADLWDLTVQRPTARRLGRHSPWGRMEIVPSADGSRFALSRASGESLVVVEASTGAELLALRGHLGLNFGILGFFGARGQRLAAYDDHGLLVTFDATRGHELAAQIDVLPRARELYEETMQSELYLERAVDRLREETELTPELRTATLELALDAGRDRATVLGEIELALVRPRADAHELARAIERGERLASLEIGRPDSVRIQALALLRKKAYSAARERALSASAELAAKDPLLEGVLALSELGLGNLAAASPHREALAQLLHADSSLAVGGAQALLAEIDATLTHAHPAPPPPR
jgi:WD40 repeat protein/serine/threonine protein kinase